MSLGSIKAANATLDACYGDNHASTWPSTIWLHLYVSDPTQGGTELTSAGGYAPVSVANTTANWPNASGGLKTNGAAFSFAAASAAWSGPADYLWLADAQTAVLPPATPTVTNVGATGTTAWYYVVTSLSAQGESTGSGTGVTTTGSATLNGTNYNTVSWAAATGATSYNVYQSTDNVHFYLLANTASTSYNDQGAAVGTQTPPVSNTTLTLLDGGPLSAPIIVPGASYVVSFVANSIVIAT